MKRGLVLVVGIVLSILVVNVVSAITGSMGNARMVIYTHNGNDVVKSILVKNVNNMSTSGDLGPEINLFEEQFILQPGEEKNAFFVINVNHTSSKEGQIIIKFFPLNSTEPGVALSATIIVIANETIEQRLSTLESWKETITTTLSDIWNAITNLVTKTDNLDQRITALENQTPTIINNTIFVNGSNSAYFKYLGSTDRKNMVCGYAEDNHLTQLSDLGWNCTITYRQTSSGEKSSCKCKKIE
jgi:hypothetical protein